MGNALSPLFEHNLWANLRLLDACRGLTQEQLSVTIAGVYGTPAATFVHYLRGEQRYISRLGGEPPEIARGAIPWPGVDALAGHAQRSGEGLLALAERLDPAYLTRQEFERTMEIEAGVILVQAINHSTEHRAHIVTTLSAHGIEMPEIDGWAWGEATGRARPA